LCIIVQMNYFNKALDTFSTNVYVTTHASASTIDTLSQCQPHVLRRIFVMYHPLFPHSLSRFQYT
jgi:hypothetical protein